ncbi:MAG: FixH family protein [Gammaproteobacteria bacterium]|nr:FixH family protein [Gammaproteobacteria bacterium]
MNSNIVAQVPWYSVPMVWLLIALPAAAVAAGFTMLWFAIATDDGVVADDYYRRGKEINLVLSRDHAAAAKNLKASLQLDAAQRELLIKLEPATIQPPQLEVLFLHATREGNDRRLLLSRADDGRYRGQILVLAPGRYNIQLAANDWRLIGSLRAPGDARIDVLPAVSR